MLTVVGTATSCSACSCRRAGRWSCPASTAPPRSGRRRSRSRCAPRSSATTRSGSTTTSTTSRGRRTRPCSSAGRRSPRSASSRPASGSDRWSAATATATRVLAKITSTIDVISGGRLDWGIGAGWYENEYRAYGYDFPKPKDRIGMLRECVEIVKSMWTEPETTYEGKYYETVARQLRSEAAPVAAPADLDRWRGRAAHAARRRPPRRLLELRRQARRVGAQARHPERPLRGGRT